MLIQVRGLFIFSGIFLPPSCLPISFNTFFFSVPPWTPELLAPQILSLQRFRVASAERESLQDSKDGNYTKTEFQALWEAVASVWLASCCKSKCGKKREGAVCVDGEWGPSCPISCLCECVPIRGPFMLRFFIYKQICGVYASLL